MIIVKLIGGLGNQMFQYAAGKSLAIKKKTDLKLDIEGFKTYKLHNYMLDKLNIKAEIATSEEIEKIFGSKILKLLYRIPKLNPFFSFNQRIRKEKSFNFDQELFNLSGTEFYLDGYWQTEKYFFDIEHIIKEDFCPLEKLGGQNVAMADLILKNNSVSVHIRRGDYVSNPVTNDFHGICNLDYYNKAIEIIIKKNPDAVFFIFSDDYNWAKENIKNNYKKYFTEFVKDYNIKIKK